MTDFLRAAIELMCLLPAMLLACLPVKGHLRMPPARLAAIAVPLILFLSGAGGAVSCFFHVGTLWLLYPAAAVMGIFYVQMLKTTRWKSVSVFLAVCGVFSCLGSSAIAVNSIFRPSEPALPLSLRGALLWFAMCCLSVLAVWYPATHASRRLLEDESFAQTWYVFWIVPILFIGLNLSLIPKNPNILGQGRLRQLYLLLSLAFLFLLLLFYLLFYLMASSLNRNDRLRQENQLLSMQQARYDSLQSAIEQTRHARHDMRHHFHILQGFAAQGNWESLSAYLDEVQGRIPDSDLGLCKNTAVDSVAGYFAMRYREQGIPVTFVLNLPQQLPIPESELCSVLSNLLENAMEAGLRTAPERRQTTVKACLHSSHMVLLSVENAYDGKVREKDGVFLSSKRPGEGVGLQAVRHAAEKSGGYVRFHYGNGVFTANVMLRGEA